jgi:4-hydroxy-tetrahydrodipicolinate synthase
VSAPADLRGVIGAVLTPFRPDGTVDRDLLRVEVDVLVGHCDAVSVLGAEASEHRVLPPADRRELLRWTVARVDGRVPVLAGVTAASPAETAELAALAADAGATHAQVLVPRRSWGGEPTAAELVAFAEAVVEDSPLPVVLYHNPGHGSDPALEALVAMCAVPGVVAIKDSSRNVSRVLRAVEEIQHAGHAAYFGTIQPLLTVLLSGGAGAMTPPPATLVAAAIRDAVDAGDLARAAELQRLVAIFPARFTPRHGLAAVMKTAAAELGLLLGVPAPLATAVPPGDAADIAAAVAAWPRIPAAAPRP